MDVGKSIQQTSDRGYIITGFTTSYGAGGRDVWLVKTDSAGNKIWDKTFGGSHWDEGYSVQQTSDGGYILTGYTSSYGAGDYDIWLIKTDAHGDKAWDRTFGGLACDISYSVRQTPDGGYIIAGWTDSYGAGWDDVWLIKTDTSGNKLWDRTFGGADWDQGHSAQRASDGGYVIAGLTMSYGAGDSDVWLVKTDAIGNRLWDRRFGGAFDDEASSVQQTSDGGYIIAGWTDSSGVGDYDVLLVKTDSVGNKVWNRTLGGANADRGLSVEQTSDGGFILAGSTDSYGAGYHDAWLVKIDPTGNKVWDRTFGGPGYDVGSSVQQTSDGGYIVAGYTTSHGAGSFDVWLIKTDAEGN